VRDIKDQKSIMLPGIRWNESSNTSDRRISYKPHLNVLITLEELIKGLIQLPSRKKPRVRRCHGYLGSPFRRELKRIRKHRWIA
jgi:hypothetical protein